MSPPLPANQQPQCTELNSKTLIPRRRRAKPGRIGEVLQEAGLISVAQIELALHDQINSFKLRLGEILSLRGWIESDIVDFFVEQWPEIIAQEMKKPLGHYLKAAGLLDDAQIEAILKEQITTGV